MNVLTILFNFLSLFILTVEQRLSTGEDNVTQSMFKHVLLFQPPESNTFWTQKHLNLQHFESLSINSTFYVYRFQVLVKIWPSLLGMLIV